jgi:metallo-beta-lactamase family protein
VYATPATLDLIEVMLRDSAHLMMAEAARARRHGRESAPEATPLYDLEDLAALERRQSPLGYEVPREILPGVTLTLHEAGHILGSAIVDLTLREGDAMRRLVLSGDLGQPGRPILRDPVCVESADVVVMESTYGDRNHKELGPTLDELVAAIERTLKHKHGNVIIPAFAVGRTQEILYWLERLSLEGRLPEMEVFVDSPLASEVTAITARHFELFDEEARHLIEARRQGPRRMRLRHTHTVSESMALNKIQGGAVILAASGMCEGGRITHHLKHQLPNPHSTVVITGFQAAGTLGRQLVDRAPSVRIFGESVPVRADVVTLGGFSAHADQRALLGWLRGMRQRPEALWLVHGEPRAAEALRERVLADLQWPTVGIGSPGGQVDLSAPATQRLPRLEKDPSPHHLDPKKPESGSF